MELNFLERLFTPESIIWFFLGIGASVWINIKWGYLIRKWFRMTPTVELFFYDCTADEIYNTMEGKENNYFVRFTVIKDKATDKLTFNFTDYLHKPSKTHINLDTKIDYTFWSQFKNKIDNIRKYEAKGPKPFLDDIFWRATNNWFEISDVQLTNAHRNVKAKFNII